MSQEQEGDRALAQHAHELYWNSDRSVNSIAEELGVSKGRLYELVGPFPAEGECPECGGELGYENRTARDRDEPGCLECSGHGAGSPRGNLRSGYPPPPAAGIAEDSRALIGGLVLGVAAGLLLGRFLR